MSEATTGLRKAAVERVVGGEGKAARGMREAAFANAEVPQGGRALVAKVALNAWKVTDEDVAAARQAGLTEDEIFEIVVCAAMGQATRQLDVALAAVAAACEETP